MADEIQLPYVTGRNLYAHLFNEIGEVWNGSAFVPYVSANWALYTVALTEQTGSGVYFGDIASGIGYQTLSVVVYEGSPATLGNPIVGGGTIEWDGYNPPSLPPVSPPVYPFVSREVILTLGALGAGWTTYLAIYNHDGSGEVWDGDSFEADSAANINAGAVTGVESLTTPGTYSFTVPALITEYGTYPVRAYRQLGGSRASATDTVLTPDILQNAFTLAGNVSYTHDVAYTPTQPMDFDLFSEEPGRVVIGEGRNWRFYTVAEGTTQPAVEIPLDAETDWKVTITGGGLILDLEYIDGSGLTVDTDTGEQIANVTAEQTATFKPNRWLYVNLWRKAPSDDEKVLMRRKKYWVVE